MRNNLQLKTDMFRCSKEFFNRKIYFLLAEREPVHRFDDKSRNNYCMNYKHPVPMVDSFRFWENHLTIVKNWLINSVIYTTNPSKHNDDYTTNDKNNDTEIMIIFL